VASGLARFYNRNSNVNVLVKATTPFGYVVAQPGSTFDLYGGDQSVEVIALKGTVTFIHAGDNAKYQVVPGSPSVIADARQVGAGEPNVDADWDDWNAGRDALWAKRVSVKGDVRQVSSSGIAGSGIRSGRERQMGKRELPGTAAPTLETHSSQRRLAPFTEGRWTDLLWGQHLDFPPSPSDTLLIITATGCIVNNGWYWDRRRQWVSKLTGIRTRGVDRSEADVAGWPCSERTYYSYNPWGPAASCWAPRLLSVSRSAVWRTLTMP